MQLAKVVIASILILAVCVEGLLEGKGCVLKYVKNFLKLLSATLKLFAVTTNCCMFIMCKGKNSIFTSCILDVVLLVF